MKQRALKALFAAAALCLLFAGGAKADFFDAAKWGDVKLMQQYLEQGVDINARDASRMGSTALHYAAGAQKAEAVVFLLGRGADINALDDYGQTPLHGAATLMEPDIALLLMERGADALVRDRKGKSPLIVANRDTRRAMLDALPASAAMEDDALIARAMGAWMEGEPGFPEKEGYRELDTAFSIFFHGSRWRIWAKDSGGAAILYSGAFLWQHKKALCEMELLLSWTDGADGRRAYHVQAGDILINRRRLTGQERTDMLFDIFLDSRRDLIGWPESRWWERRD